MIRLLNSLSVALLAAVIFAVITTIGGIIALIINLINNTYLHWSVGNLLLCIVAATLVSLTTIYYRMN